jgi:hypothetical protein
MTLRRFAQFDAKLARKLAFQEFNLLIFKLLKSASGNLIRDQSVTLPLISLLAYSNLEA